MEYRADWQLGNDWNELLSESISICNKSMWQAHNDPSFYDEWLRSLQVLRTLCIVKQEDRKKLDKMLTNIEELMKRTNTYSSNLSLDGDSGLRKKIDDALRHTQTEMISILHDNNLIVKKSAEKPKRGRPGFLNSVAE